MVLASVGMPWTYLEICTGSHVIGQSASYGTSCRGMLFATIAGSIAHTLDIQCHTLERYRNWTLAYHGWNTNTSSYVWKAFIVNAERVNTPLTMFRCTLETLRNITGLSTPCPSWYLVVPSIFFVAPNHWQHAIISFHLRVTVDVRSCIRRFRAWKKQIRCDFEGACTVCVVQRAEDATKFNDLLCTWSP